MLILFSEKQCLETIFQTRFYLGRIKYAITPPLLCFQTRLFSHCRQTNCCNIGSFVGNRFILLPWKRIVFCFYKIALACGFIVSTRSIFIQIWLLFDLFWQKMVYYILELLLYCLQNLKYLATFSECANNDIFQAIIVRSTINVKLPRSLFSKIATLIIC